MKKNFTLSAFIFFALSARSQNVTTVAGQYHVQGSANGTGTAATFNGPHAAACDNLGNVYIADRNNHKIRKITAAGVVTTFAGSGTPGSTDGTGTAASFNEPWGIACDNLGNVYIADTKNFKIRKITPSGAVTTLTGTGSSAIINGPLASAAFGFPTGIAVASDGTMYVTEFNNHIIRKIHNGSVSTLAGVPNLFGDVDGAGNAARFYQPHSAVIDKQGNVMVADVGNNKIRKVTPSGNVTTWAGNGIPGYTNGSLLSSQFNLPFGITADSTGAVYVCDLQNSVIRKLNAAGVTTFAGTPAVFGHQDGPLLQATFDGISGIAFSFFSNALYIADEGNQLIRKISFNTSGTQPLSISTNSSNNTFCLASSVVITASPSGLSNYVFKEGTSVIGTSSTGSITVTNLTVGTHNITCTATGAGGAQYATTNPVTITITSSPQPATISPPGPVGLCSGSSVVLTASLGSSYLWSNGATTRAITVSAAGSYSVTVYNTGGCTQNSVPTIVNIVPNATATISPANPPPKCNGDSILLTANPATSYQWNNGATTQSIYAHGTGTYMVTITNINGCTATSLPVNVTIYPSATANISPSSTLVYGIQGQSVALSVNAGSSYLWSNGATTQSINVTTGGTYSVKLTNINGCVARDTTTVQMLSSSSVMSAQGPVTFCPGQSVVLHSMFATGNQWYKNNVIISGAVSQNYTATQTGYYKVKITLAGGGTLTSDSISVVVKNVPTSITAISDTACIGGEAELAVIQQPGASYTWFNEATGGIALANGLSYITDELYENKTYYVQVAANGCIAPARFPVKAYIYPEINPTFSFSEAATVQGGFEVQFTNTTETSGITYAWDFGDPSSANNTSTAFNTSHIYTDQGDFDVTLTSYTSKGCVDTAMARVRVQLMHELYLPSAFTPNNDGMNDIFRLRGTQIVSSTMIIFNQWGQQIFTSDNAEEGWDGTIGGKTVQNGTYKYIVKADKEDVKNITLTGNISVIK